MKLVSLVTIVFTSVSALASPPTAVLDITAKRGEKIVEFKTSKNRNEICVVPKHSELGSYSKDDLETEKELCSFDFQGLTASDETKTMVVCPKINSTNPGVLVMDMPEEGDKKTFEAEKCFSKSDRTKTRAKFKQTVTCSYTPSLLTYYHFSRMLEGAGRVPVSVLRTMEKDSHLKVTLKGQKASRSVGGAIYAGWNTLEERHEHPLNNLSTFDSTGQFVYGALQDNINNEAVYNEINGGGAYDSRHANFMKKPSIVSLKDPRGVLQIAGSNQFEKAAQKILELKDATDLILLDTLLTQNDRMYNLHFKWAWLWIEEGKVKTKFSKGDVNDDGVISFKTKKELEEKQKYLAKNAQLVKVMVLKDNDCGVRAGMYTNKMKNVNALATIRHISGKTYTSFLKLAQALKSEDFAEYLQAETLMADADLKLIRANVSAAEADLRAKCHSGALKLDLDLETYFGDEHPQFKCDI